MKFIYSKWLEEQISIHMLQAMMPKQNACKSWNLLATIKDKPNNRIKM